MTSIKTSEHSVVAAVYQRVLIYSCTSARLCLMFLYCKCIIDYFSDLLRS